MSLTNLPLTQKNVLSACPAERDEVLDDSLKII